MLSQGSRCTKNSFFVMMDDLFFRNYKFKCNISNYLEQLKGRSKSIKSFKASHKSIILYLYRNSLIYTSNKQLDFPLSPLHPLLIYFRLPPQVKQIHKPFMRLVKKIRQIYRTITRVQSSASIIEFSPLLTTYYSFGQNTRHL